MILFRSIFTLIISITLINSGFGQNSISDTINQTNSKGKKHGLWIQYLDSLIQPTDKSKAKYYRYLRYQDGKNNIDTGHRKKYKFQNSETSTRLKEPIPLNGTFVWVRTIKVITTGERKVAKIEDTYYNGYPVTFKVFSNNRLFELLDFTKLYKGIPGTFYYEFGSREPKKRYYYCEGIEGWKLYSVNNLVEKEKSTDK
jgi:hypothetical protein